MLVAAAELEVPQATLDEELAKQETSNRSVMDFDTWIDFPSFDVYFDAAGAFFSSLGSGIYNMGSGLVNAVVQMADTVILGLVDISMTAYGIYDPIYRWEPVSTVGQGTQQFLDSGGTLQEFYTDAGISMAADLGTFEPDLQGDWTVFRGRDTRLDGCTVVSSTQIPGVHRVYNMTIEDEHVYRVARHGVLVHNNG